MNKLTIDFETRSAAPLKDCGAAAYAQHPTTEVICLALKWHGQLPVIWYSPPFRELGLDSIPDEQVEDMVSRAEIIEAHNASFEFNIWNRIFYFANFF